MEEQSLKLSSYALWQDYHTVLSQFRTAGKVDHAEPNHAIISISIMMGYVPSNAKVSPDGQ